MSLRAKILVILSAVVLLFAAIDYLIQRRLVFDSFVALERQEATRDLGRVVQALESEVRHLDRRCEDWAAWDDTWQFVVWWSREYVNANLGPEGFHKNQINLLYICDTKGKVVWGRIMDLADDKPIVLRELSTETLSPSHPLLSAQGQKAGLWMTEHGPLLVSSKPILDSRRHGPSRGTVIMGRFLTDPYIEELRERTGVMFHAWPINGEPLSAEHRTILGEVTASAAPLVNEGDIDNLYAWTTFSGAKKAPPLLIRADVPREITSEGARSVRYASFSVVAAGLLFMLVLLNLLQRTVLQPLATVTQHAVEIGQNDETLHKLDLRRNDEIGVLSREFDRMLGKLAESRAAVVKSARAAGMSEIATAVLHNVGNVLNSVNVSATVVAQKLSTSNVEDLQLAMKTVRDSSADLASFLKNDPRGEHLQPLLDSLTEQLANDHAAIREEVQALSLGIDHIQELVRAQQNHAGRAGVLETTSPCEAIEAAIAMALRSGDGMTPIEIVREYDVVPSCTFDRHRLTEILVNLFQNAREAILASPALEGRLTIRLRRPSPGRLSLEVEDNGVGIQAGHLERIFTHGFTTKKDGHGFGLHACVNSAREMGGSLCARSQGPGFGSTFVLDLPVREPSNVLVTSTKS